MRSSRYRGCIASCAALAGIGLVAFDPVWAGDRHPPSHESYDDAQHGYGGHDDAGRHGGGGASYVDQVEANTSKVVQHGDGNSVNVNQRAVPAAGSTEGRHGGHVSDAVANRVIAGQAGEMNAINATQDGAANALVVGQYGSDNGVTSQQRGANNTAAVGQAGTNLNANIDQSGNGLSVGVLQFGAGDGRAVTVRQR